jgi:hypothetical protein
MLISCSANNYILLTCNIYTPHKSVVLLKRELRKECQNEINASQISPYKKDKIKTTLCLEEQYFSFAMKY